MFYSGVCLLNWSLSSRVVKIIQVCITEIKDSSNISKNPALLIRIQRSRAHIGSTDTGRPHTYRFDALCEQCSSEVSFALGVPTH